MTCPHCGSPVERGRVLCPRCQETSGAAIAIAASRAAAEAAPGEMTAQPSTLLLPAVETTHAVAAVEDEPAPPPPFPPKSAVRPPASSSRPPDRPLRAGEKVAGRYTVVAALGRASFGAHYRARDEGGQAVSLWITRADDSAAQAALALAPALQAISHRNLAQTRALLRDGDRILAVTEPVEGESLARHLARKAAGRGLPLQSAINVVLQIAAAVRHAEEAGVVHGALGLEAVMVLHGGRLKVVGYGLGVAATGGDIGALRAADSRALSTMLYELLTGRPWSPGAPAPAQIRTDVPPALDALLRRSLDRPLPVADFHEALAVAVGAKALAPEVDLAPVPEPPARPEGDRWFVVRGPLDYGPFTTEQLHREAAEGRLTDETLVKNVASGARRRLREFPALAGVLATVHRRLHEERQKAEHARLKREQRRRRLLKGAMHAAIAIAVAGGVTAFLSWRMQMPEAVRNIPLLPVEPSPRASARVSLPPTLIEVDKEDEREPGRAARKKPKRSQKPAAEAAGTLGAGVAAAGTPSVPTAPGPLYAPATPAVPDEPPPASEVDFSEQSPADVAAREEAKQAVRRSSARLRPCFDKEARRVPLRGRYTVSFGVSPAGRAYGVRVRGEGPTAELTNCIRLILSVTTFPRFKGLPLQVEYPFNITRR